jgi:TM2 domain-containing membrane protein YozV
MRDYARDYSDRDLVVHRSPPSPGIAAVLSVVLPGLGQVYAGELIPGLIWFLAVGFSYWAVIIPGFIVHGLCIYSAYRAAKRWMRY